MSEGGDERVILLATGNRGKFREIAAELVDAGIRLISLNDVAAVAECEETGATFQENAEDKARIREGGFFNQS